MKEKAMQREIDLVTSLDDGSGGSSGNNGGKFTGGNGDGNRDYNPGNFENFKKVSPEEKYAAYGRIARECLLYNGRSKSGKPSYMQEIRDLEAMRAILSSPNFPFKPAFDMNTRKIYYYIEKNFKNGPKYKKVSTKGMYDYLYREYFKDEQGHIVFHQHEPVLLNSDFSYVYRNMMKIDNDEVTITMDSLIPEEFTFVPEKEVYDYVKSIVNLDRKAKPNQVDKLVNYVDDMKRSYRDYGTTIFDIILGELLYGV